MFPISVKEPVDCNGYRSIAIGLRAVTAYSALTLYKAGIEILLGFSTSSPYEIELACSLHVAYLPIVPSNLILSTAASFGKRMGSGFPKV